MRATQRLAEDHAAVKQLFARFARISPTALKTRGGSSSG